MPDAGEAPEIRSYRARDFEACLDVFDSNRPKYFSAEERLQFAAFLQQLPGPYLVVEDREGNIVACGGYAIDADTAIASFCWGMVERSHHRQGIGRRLSLARLEDIRRQPGVRGIRLDTGHHTRGFYENLGFRLMSVEKDGYWPGLDRCEMEWRADPSAA